jgi:hypothetical protein
MTITVKSQILESPFDRRVWKSFSQAQFTYNKVNTEGRFMSLSDNTLTSQLSHQFKTTCRTGKKIFLIHYCTYTQNVNYRFLKQHNRLW